MTPKDNGERVRAYLEAHIITAGKYPLHEISDERLTHIAMMLPAPAVPFSDWERKVYGVTFEEMSDEEAAEINEKAQQDSKDLYGK